MKVIIAFLAIAFASQAYGNERLLRQIDRCEQRRGDACIYEILRELARTPNPIGEEFTLTPAFYEHDGQGTNFCPIMISPSASPADYQLRFVGTCSLLLEMSCQGSVCMGSNPTSGVQFQMRVTSPTSFALYRLSDGGSALFQLTR